MGSVFEARATPLGRHVALKILHRHVAHRERSDGGTGLQWDGADAWLILRETLGPGPDEGYDLDNPLFHDDTAYVANGILVARIPHALTPTGLAVAPSSLIAVDDVLMAGNLVQVAGGQWELQHLVAAFRVPVQSLLPALARSPDPNNNLQPICQTAMDYDEVRNTLCSFVDINSVPKFPANVPLRRAFRKLADGGETGSIGRRRPVAGGRSAPVPCRH
jgi:hypothetical protein